MLVRAAGRTHRRQSHTPLHLTQLADSLYLPFLCPAQLRWTARQSHRLHSSQPSTPLRLQSRLQHGTERHTRNLATVADSYQSAPTSQYPPPVLSDANTASWDAFPSSDAHVPFIELKESIKTDDESRPIRSGMGGTIDDMLENVETNLRVGRFARCKIIIRKMTERPITRDYIIYVHLKFLDARLDSMSAGQESPQDVFIDMRDWFDNEVLANQVELDPRFLVIMLRGALQGLPPGAKRERTIKDIYQLAVERGEHVVDEVINSEQYTDEDLWALVEVVPEFAAEDLGLHDADKGYKEHEAEERQASSSEEQPSLPYDTPDVLPGIFSDLPRIIDTAQKGFGLESVKDTLARAAPALNPAIYNDPSRTPLTPRQRQHLIEESASAAAISRWKHEDKQLRDMGIHSSLDPSRPLGALMWQWYSALLPALEEELALCREALTASESRKLHNERLAYAAHLESVPLPQVAATTILYVMDLVVSSRDKEELALRNMKLARLTVGLGKALQQEADLIAQQKASTKPSKSPRRTISKKIVRPRTLDVPTETQWPTAVRIKLGAMLVSKLIETAKVSVSRPHPRTKEIITRDMPAFLYKTVFEFGRRVGILTACSDLIKKMHAEPVGHLIAKRLPMVIEPEPWTGFSKGGYLYYPNSVIRFSNVTDTVPRDYARAAMDRGDLDKVFSALDALGRIPWTVNKEVLRVQLEAWNSGEMIANFAPREPKLEAPRRPENDEDMHAMRLWKAELKAQSDKASSYHSQRCFQNFQLEIARAFVHEKMYFPHNLDFRGRAYPIPPYLNHMGADNARGLMKFANGKELGVEGLRWLKIHVANVFGYDKASLQEREDFVMEHLPDIYDSATNPLDGNRWWLKSEDAWQTLAACYELKAALDSPDPTKFVSTLPIHQDGTCNGLQHYAALGGDSVGAKQVNLEPGDRPSDVYTAVADAVRAEVERDFNEGHPVAKMLHGRISRKVVKQPVMTNVYGVTFYGARAQVRKQLQEMFPDLKRDDPIDHLTMASYVAKKIFKSLGEMFTGAQNIQQWLGECADRITTCVTKEQIEQLRRDADALSSGVPAADQPPRHRKAGRKPAAIKYKESPSIVNVSKQLFRSSVIWTTPLRLPVVQPYRSKKVRTVQTTMSRMTLREPSVSDPVSRRKQLQGFAPNFIHSLDATHMMLSANKCSELGITFASIHDSFWTHACDINNMSRILRDAFVDMHSEDIVDRLRHEFMARYQGAMYLASIDARTPVGKKLAAYQVSIEPVKKEKGRGKAAATQPYQIRSLLQEVERLRLLQSEDPEERQRGAEMVTGGSIFAAEKDAEQALTLPSEISDAKLGDIPDSDGPDVDFSASSVLEPDMDGDEIEADVVVNGAKVHHDVPAELSFDGDKVSDEEFIKQLKVKSGEKKKPTTRGQVKKCLVWLPLQFPAVPEKGSFDVRRLKDSTYFFH